MKKIMLIAFLAIGSSTHILSSETSAVTPPTIKIAQLTKPSIFRCFGPVISGTWYGGMTSLALYGLPHALKEIATHTGNSLLEKFSFGLSEASKTSEFTAAVGITGCLTALLYSARKAQLDEFHQNKTQFNDQAQKQANDLNLSYTAGYSKGFDETYKSDLKTTMEELTSLKEEFKVSVSKINNAVEQSTSNLKAVVDEFKKHVKTEELKTPLESMPTSRINFSQFRQTQSAGASRQRPSSRSEQSLQTPQQPANLLNLLRNTFGSPFAALQKE